jgi:hypothetical protein
MYVFDMLKVKDFLSYFWDKELIRIQFSFTGIVVGIGGKSSEPRSLLDPLSKLGESLKGNGFW